PAAKQFVDRCTVILALDIPERLVDTGDGTHEYRSTAVEAGPVKLVPDTFDFKRVPADDRLHHFDDRRFYSGRFPFDDRFPPTNTSIIGLHLQKQPSRRYCEQFIASDRHVPTPPCVWLHACVCLDAGVRLPRLAVHVPTWC